MVCYSKVKLLYKGAFKNNRINGYGQKYFKTHCNIVEYNGYFKMVNLIIHVYNLMNLVIKYMMVNGNKV